MRKVGSGAHLNSELTPHVGGEPLGAGILDIICIRAHQGSHQVNRAELRAALNPASYDRGDVGVASGQETRGHRGRRGRPQCGDGHRIEHADGASHSGVAEQDQSLNRRETGAHGVIGKIGVQLGREVRCFTL